MFQSRPEGGGRGLLLSQVSEIPGVLSHPTAPVLVRGRHRRIKGGGRERDGRKTEE